MIREQICTFCYTPILSLAMTLFLVMTKLYIYFLISKSFLFFNKKIIFCKFSAIPIRILSVPWNSARMPLKRAWCCFLQSQQWSVCQRKRLPLSQNGMFWSSSAWSWVSWFLFHWHCCQNGSTDLPKNWRGNPCNWSSHFSFSDTVSLYLQYFFSKSSSLFVLSITSWRLSFLWWMASWSNFSTSLELLSYPQSSSFMRIYI